MTSDLTTKAAEIRAGLEGVVERHAAATPATMDCRAWHDIGLLLALIEQQAGLIASLRQACAAQTEAGKALHGAYEVMEARATTAESERDSWRRVCERLETEKQAALAERDELLREKERLEAALQKLHDAASVFHNAALVHLSDTTFDSDGGLSEADAELSVNALPGARSALENGPAGLADAHPKSPDQPERDTGPRFNERAGSEIAAQRQQEEREPNGHRKNSCSEPGGNSRPLGEE